MAVEVMVPRIGWSMEKGVFAGWALRDGERVEPGQALFSIEADKSVEEVLAEEGGRIRFVPGAAEAGTELRVGTVIAYLLGEGEADPDFAALSGGPAPTVAPAGPSAPPSMAIAPRAPGAAAPKAGSAEAASRLAAPRAPATPTARAAPTARAVPSPRAPATRAAPTARSHATRGADRARKASSPRARRVARETGVDWTILAGTGRGGRVVERDVRAASTRPAPVGRAIATIKARADAAAFLRLARELDSCAEGEGGFGRAALLGRLAAAAYEAAAGIPGGVAVAFGAASASGIRYAEIADAARRRIPDVAAELRAALSARADAAGPAIPPPASGLAPPAFSLLDLAALGIDEYSPGSLPPGGMLVAVGGPRSPGGLGGEAVMTISLAFDEAAASLAACSRFLERLRGAIEAPALYLAR